MDTVRKESYGFLNGSGAGCEMSLNRNNYSQSLLRHSQKNQIKQKRTLEVLLMLFSTLDNK